MRSRSPLAGPWTVLPLALLLLEGKAEPNGAAWKWPMPPGTPGPVRRAGLVLEREDVEFRHGRGLARFWVRNNTERPVATAMGFPLAVANTRRENRRPPEAMAEDPTPEAAEAARLAIRVEVEGKAVPSFLKMSTVTEYPAVIGWKMTFAPRTRTAFSVSYPIRYGWFSGASTAPIPRDGGTVAFRYITHTGAYWAGPIGEATLRFCDEKLIKLYLEVPAGREWEHAGWTYGEVRWKVGPSPFALDRQAGCLVWERKAWTPARGKDDLEVRVEWSPPQGDLPEEGRLFDRWCGLYATVPGEGENESKRPDALYREVKRQLGAEMKVDLRALDAAGFEKIERAAWARLRQNRRTLTLEEAPFHFRAMVRQRLLEYLRNYPYGVRDHAFKIERLRSCFSTVKGSRKGPLTSVERANLRFVTEEEARTSAALAEALATLRRAPPARRGDLRDWVHWSELAR
jgi:hypothetical protein